MTTDGIGLRRLQHLVLWVSDVERSVRFYRDVLGFEVKVRYPNAAFLRIPGSGDDHHLGLFEQRGAPPPDEGVARMYHSAWEVGELTDLARARRRLIEAGALVVSVAHGVSLSLYAKNGRARVRGLLDGARRQVRRYAAPRPRGELARRGIPMP